MLAGSKCRQAGSKHPNDGKTNNHQGVKEPEQKRKDKMTLPPVQSKDTSAKTRLPTVQ